MLYTFDSFLPNILQARAARDKEKPIWFIWFAKDWLEGESDLYGFENEHVGDLDPFVVAFIGKDLWESF